MLLRSASPHFLNGASIPYLTVRYGEIAQDLGVVVERVAEFLCVDLPTRGGNVSPTLRTQADQASERFIGERTRVTGGGPMCEPKGW